MRGRKETSFPEGHIFHKHRGKGGRPRLLPKYRRSEKLLVTFTPDEMDFIKSESERLDVTKSAFIRKRSMRIPL